ncbi:LytTR family DNA-binding domain-containing protein [Apibacter raozihei]|uniref:LytR/AlgR family response regulator transcription factor n=1 Tax=Apibacter raozihei TaxID=2500547 RepID=UPI000FE2FE44|nr:LytTR family DNA-binding domain-containing protein [Apibacter raozihei]
MKVLIVEDETAAFETLEAILKDIDSSIEVMGNTESVSQTVKWLQNNPEPDLILMDIHLSDGDSFLIFEYLKVDTPIIFTTAYNEYAIDAFKQNSIDYLLKPIKPEDLERALNKFKKWTQKDFLDYLSRLPQLASKPQYNSKILVPIKDKLLPISLSDVSFFYTTDKNTQVTLKDGQSYPISKTLEQIYMKLNPADFYRANKQFIIARSSVENITIWFDNRLLVSLNTDIPERIYVSKNKAAEFKTWMVNE